MGAVIIGVGVAVAAIGIVLGAIGFGSSETTSGAALFTVGSIVFVGGLVLFALGSIQRAVVDVANKLDGVLHFEPDEEHGGLSGHDGQLDGHPVERPLAAARHEAPEDAPAPVVPPLRLDPLPPVRPAAPEPAPVSARLPEPEPAPAPVVDEEKTASGGRGLPSWFRRKPAPEPEAEPEIVIEETVVEIEEPAPAPAPVPPPLSSESLRREVPSFLREGLSRPSVERPSTQRASTERMSTERPVPPAFGDEPFEPRPPLPERRPFTPFASAPPPPPPAPEPVADDTPTFLNVSDLLDDPVEETPEEPPVTLLKAGVIGGMAYKLYSDGSIEADLPDGTLRFASLQDLRDHVAASSAKPEG